MFSKSNLLLFPATFLASTASAQDFIKNNTVGSCLDVDCPTRPNSTMADCRIQNQTHSFIGLRTFDTAITPYQENVTWTVGMTKHDGYDEQGRNESTITVEKDFYLGTPPGLNLTNASLPYQGCAILFSGNVAMGLPANHRNSGGPCEDIIGNSCIPSLITQTRTLIAVNGSRYNNQSDGQACERLKEDFRLSFPRACIGLTAEESWKDISALPLTGPSAISPPSESANASSNCHPTLPKSNVLSKAFAYNQTMVYGRGSEVQIINNIDLVLTVFWSPDGEVEDALEEPDAHAVCLHPINLDEETPDANEGMAARSVRWSSTAAVGAAAIFFAGMFM